LKDEDTILEYYEKLLLVAATMVTDRSSFLRRILILFRTPYYMWGSNTHPAYWIGFFKGLSDEALHLYGAFTSTQ